jgi:DNA-binding IclR family transcriptional regulator
MAPAPIPEDIRRFVLTSIPSVPHLEALLLLRADAPRGFGTADLARRLYLSDKAAATLLAELCRAGMIAPSDGDCDDPPYQYAPATPALRATIDTLADLYARHLVDITHLIHAKLDRKAQQFADAFTWRKEP